jgi:hypothetical protein
MPQAVFADTSLPKSGFIPGPVHVGSVAEGRVLEQVFLQVMRFLLVYIMPPYFFFCYRHVFNLTIWERR